MSEPTANYTVRRRPRRGRETLRDMVLSMGAICAGVAVILVITHRPLPDPIHVVQTAPVIAQARASVSWPVADPSPRLRGWRVTSARLEPAPGIGATMVTFGWVTPDRQWVGMAQAGVPVGSARAKKWAAAVVSAAGRGSGMLLAGDARRTVLVFGTGSEQQRREVMLAAGLAP